PGSVGSEQGEDRAFGDREVDPVEHDVVAEGLAYRAGADRRRGHVDRQGFLPFSGAVGCRGVHRRRAAPHGGLSSPSPALAAVPPESPRTPPTPAAPPAARAGHRPAAPGLRAPDRPVPGIRSRRSPSTGARSRRCEYGPSSPPQPA